MSMMMLEQVWELEATGENQLKLCGITSHITKLPDILSHPSLPKLLLEEPQGSVGFREAEHL